MMKQGYRRESQYAFACSTDNGEDGCWSRGIKERVWLMKLWCQAAKETRELRFVRVADVWLVSFKVNERLAPSAAVLGSCTVEKLQLALHTAQTIISGIDHCPTRWSESMAE